MTVPLRLAVVIPAYRETASVRRLLGLLDAFRGIDEIVISAAAIAPADLDSLQTLDRDIRIVTGSAGRGEQLNRGRAATNADLLWFVHADATPPASGPAQIRESAANGARGGFFQFRFEGVESKAAARLARLINWRARRGIPYGDQGLWFDAQSFDSAGGYEPVPLFEEVSLIKKVRQSNAFVPMAASIGVDPKRWQQNGWIRRTLCNRALAIGHGFGVSPHRLARWYYGK